MMMENGGLYYKNIFQFIMFKIYIKITSKEMVLDGHLRYLHLYWRFHLQGNSIINLVILCLHTTCYFRNV